MCSSARDGYPLFLSLGGRLINILKQSVSRFFEVLVDRQLHGQCGKQ